MWRKYIKWIIPLVFTLSLWSIVAQAAVWPSGREAVELQARPFSLSDVRLLDGPFRQAMLRTQKYLHELESDRLLWYFRKTAGLDTPGEPMGGWEKTELRGHTMGHYLSGCALMYASTDDKKLKVKADAIVAELAKCQKKIGTGYLSAYPEEQIDRVIACKRVWAPWYTLHKIYAGLLDMYIYCNNNQALEIAKSMASWAKGRFDPLDRNAMQEMLNHTEQGGMNEVLANLYGLTGNKQWLQLAKRFNADEYNKPLILHHDELKGKHVNSFIPNIVG
ncbi:MAG: glycoside hydrolase family 127 protein, partial [Phycisphaerales bacterium]